MNDEGQVDTTIFPPPGHGPWPPVETEVVPLSRAELDALGWDACDVILVTGDAFVDHPSFGVAVIARVLLASGFRVGIIAQPDWRSPAAFAALGRPRLFFGVTAGNLDSLVNRFTADKRPRSDDAYTPDDEPNRRPDRATIAYARRCREAFPDVPIILGGLEASLRRAAHYDYWSDSVRRSILIDAQADLLLYGNAERAVVAVARRLAASEPIETITDVRGTVFARPAGKVKNEGGALVQLPSFDEVSRDPYAYAHAARLIHLEARSTNSRTLVQRHDTREVWLRPPPVPLSTPELDWIYELPYQRVPHPAYTGRRLAAYETVQFSITILRGCFGGCTFCSLAAHEGLMIQSRSAESILREIALVRDLVPGFTGIISDLGGPTANMYQMGCGRKAGAGGCHRLSCLFPDICRSLITSHAPLIDLYRRARMLPGIKKVLIGSGVRHDLALTSPEYIRELVSHHVGGYLKVAPEHICPGPLAAMQKPGLRTFDRFRELFERYSRAVGKEQYLIPYFIAAHPGTTDEDMLTLACWLKQNRYRLDQVQTFLPSPMTLATAMYHTGKNPLHPIRRGAAEIIVPKRPKIRRLHKAFLRYHDPANWPLLREALRIMGRADLIGQSPHHLVPAYKPASNSGRLKSRHKPRKS
jgi:uncharacterized radical SAM protein YgiQ